jgi:hypothetical protein
METPSQLLIVAAAQLGTTSDKFGRRLTVRRLSALDRLRLFKAVGSELAQNAPYFGLAALAASVIDIDGVPVPPPMTEAQLESLVQRLGDEGIEAVALLFEASDQVTPSETEMGNWVGTPIWWTACIWSGTECHSTLHFHYLKMIGSPGLRQLAGWMD